MKEKTSVTRTMRINLSIHMAVGKATRGNDQIHMYFFFTFSFHVSLKEEYLPVNPGY